jgi:SAM-dependent methyltransferase
MSISMRVLQSFYRKAEGRAERLPWHRERPSHVLDSAVAACTRPARALDLGCGAGVLTLWLADKGLEVTGIDLLPEAIAMARALADRRGVTVELLTMDLFDFSATRPFDLVYDSGCMHSLVGGNLRRYKDALISWLAPGGEFVLEHWGKRHFLDWRPIGPRRRSRAAIERMLAPELRLVETEETDFAAPLPFGPTVRGVGYWFHRAPSAKEQT